MDNVKDKIEALIPEIKRNGEKLRLLERNLDAEKLKLRRKIRQGENTFFSMILMMKNYYKNFDPTVQARIEKSDFFSKNDILSFHLFLVPMSNSKKL